MLKEHLREKRNEIIWALLAQGYTYAEVGVMFNNLNRSTILRVDAKKPKDYKPKWVKREGV